jgi:hypothetical protein
VARPLKVSDIQVMLYGRLLAFQEKIDGVLLSNINEGIAEEVGNVSRKLRVRMRNEI